MSLSLQILLFIGLLIFLAKGIGGLAGRASFPIVLGELLAGVILGPTILDVWRFAWFSSPATAVGGYSLSLAAVVKILAGLGVVVLMFLAGLETDIEMMKGAVGPAFWAACGGVILPLVGGSLVSRAVGFGWAEAIFVGTVLTATSVSITAQTLMNLNRLRSREGSTILGAAVIDDVLGLVVLSFVIAAQSRALHTSGAAWMGVGLTLGRILLFLLLAVGLGPRLVGWVFNQTRHFHGPHAPMAVALGVAFLFAFLAESLGGMAAITGAYLAGLFVASTPAHREVIGDLRSMTNAFFGPLFFVSIGLEINARELRGHFGLFLLLLSVAMLGKVLGCGLGAWFKGFDTRDSLVVGVGMIPRGEVGLITASLGWGAHLISPVSYSMVVVLVLATTLLTPVLLRIVLPRQPLAPAPVASQPLAEVAPQS